MGQNERQWPDDMRGRSQKNFAFLKGFTHQSELVMFKISKAAMNKFGRGGRRCRGQVFLFDQQNRKTATGGITGNTCAVDAAAYDKKVVCFGHVRSPFCAGKLKWLRQ